MKKKVIYTIFLFLILIQGSLIISLDKLIQNNAKIENEKQKFDQLKNSMYNVSPIIINGNGGWASIAISESWCYGSGIINNPYIIENITIDGQGSGSCIEIKNSNVYFIIRNCTVYNSSLGFGLDLHAGIRLEDVSNGKLINNTSTNNNRNGISLIYSNNIVIANNTISYNDGFGISCGDTNTNINSSINISQNVLFDNSYPDITINYGVYVNIFSNLLYASESYSAVVTLSRSSNCSIFNNTLINGAIGVLSYSEHNIIKKNIVLNGTILIRSGSTNNVVLDCQITTDGIGIDLLGHDTPISNITISNNVINITNPVWANAFGIRIYTGVYGVELSNNTFYGQGIWITEDIFSQVSSHSIDNTNTINGKRIYYYKNINNLNSSVFSDAGQIFLINCSFFNISNLDLSYNGIGLSLYYSNNNTIRNVNSSQINNHINPDWNYGIYLFKSNQNNLSRIYINGNDRGIYLDEQSDFNTIRESVIEQCDAGITLVRNSNNNTIKMNRVEGGGSCLNLAGGSENNILHNIFMDGSFGIRFSPGSSFNFVFNNTVIGHVWGIFASSSTNNSIYFNKFVNNNDHATDSGIDNKWDNGTIGNYWDNYNGKDSDDDGIGDIPYNIAGDTGSIDYYPIWWDHLVISINSPIENSVYKKNVYYHLSISDGIANTIWYTIDNGMTNFTCNSTGMIDQIAWNNMVDGEINLIFFTNDTAGVTTIQPMNIIKDTLAPSIEIISPNSNTNFRRYRPHFSIIINDSNLESTWYSPNGGLTNISFSGLNFYIDQDVWEGLLVGEITFTIYARDLAGNIGTGSVVVIKSSPSQPLIPGYNIFLIIGAISMVSIIIAKRYHLNIVEKL